MGAVHEMGWRRVGLEVLRDVSLKQACELAKLKYWQPNMQYKFSLGCSV